LNRFREVARLHGQATDPNILQLLNDVHQFSPRSASDSDRPTMPAVSKENDPPGIRQGKYSSERAAREWSTVVDISIKPSSFKLVSLSSPRSPLSKTPKQVFF